MEVIVGHMFLRKLKIYKDILIFLILLFMVGS